MRRVLSRRRTHSTVSMRTTSSSSRHFVVRSINAFVSTTHPVGRSSAASTSSGDGNGGTSPSCTCSDMGGNPPCPITRSLPPGATADTARRRMASRGKSTGECRNADITRSYCADGRHAARSVCSHSIRSESPAFAASPAPTSRAIDEMSSAVTSQPRAASQRASAPSPDPSSSAVPGVRSDTCCATVAFTRPLHIRPCSVRRLTYRSSQNRVASAAASGS